MTLLLSRRDGRFRELLVYKLPYERASTYDVFLVSDATMSFPLNHRHVHLSSPRYYIHAFDNEYHYFNDDEVNVARSPEHARAMTARVHSTPRRRSLL